jgi:hypothetical protein
MRNLSVGRGVWCLLRGVNLSLAPVDGKAGRYNGSDPKEFAMDTDTITIPVPTKLAQAYREAPPQEKRKWELLVRFQLEALAVPSRRRSIEEVMAELGSQASENGLTEAELKSILQGPDDERSP